MFTLRKMDMEPEKGPSIAVKEAHCRDFDNCQHYGSMLIELQYE